MHFEMFKGIVNRKETLHSVPWEFIIHVQTLIKLQSIKTRSGHYNILASK